MSARIPFVDLRAQRLRIGTQIDAAIARVLDHGQFIAGPEVAELEERLATFCGARHCVSCANGTDALILILMAEGIGPGDAVFVPAFTFAATAEAVRLVGATPVFCDVLEETFNLDAESLARAIPVAEYHGLTPRAVIPVDLFGQPADYPAICAIAEQQHLAVVADAAQSFGATCDNRHVGTLAKATAVSFFPSKPLGCYGDGGAVFTNDDAIAALVRSLATHGAGAHKDDSVRIGMNSRLDTIQAAILLAKLEIFEDEIAARQAVARRYDEAFAPLVTIPRIRSGCVSVWAQYTIRLQAREAIADQLSVLGVPTAIYYPRSLPRQEAFRAFPTAPDSVAVSDKLSQHVLSLPMHPYLVAETQAWIAQALRTATRR